MTNENNELQVNTQTGEIVDTPREQVVEETDQYRVVKTLEGKYRKEMKYNRFYSRVPETDEEQMELFNIFNDQENDLVTPLKNMVNKEIDIAHVFTDPYQSFDEETGQSSLGVTTTLEDTEGNYYATSSKSVYWSLKNIFDQFGWPSEDKYRPVTVKVTGTRRQQGVQINVSLVGYAK